MKQVLKFKLPLARTSYVPMPDGAIIIKVGVQGRDICIWALCGTQEAKHARKFHVLGTGHDYEWSANHVHLGTVFMEGGALVWHIFEEHIA